MSEKISNVYQFEIVLNLPKKKVWRRIQVPESYSFKDLHKAIQKVMPWDSEHAHKFEMVNPKSGKKDMICPRADDSYDKLLMMKLKSEKETKIADYFLTPKDTALYEYDFGQGWDHNVVFEKILPAVVGITYPRCISGQYGCPPENGRYERGDKDYDKYLEDNEIEEIEDHTNYDWPSVIYSVKFDPNSVNFFD